MEILFYSKTTKSTFPISQNIRWLTVDDYEVFCSHLKLCGQRIISKREWKETYAEDTVYCGLFINDIMVSRACVEKYSSDSWEVADVRTAAEHRENGYACQVCQFVLNYILSQNKTATIRTEEDNSNMKKVIDKLGFSAL